MMKFTRRGLIKLIAVGGLISPLHSFSKLPSKNINTGDFRSLDSTIEVSGILLLEALDITMKVKEKTIYGDGHGHVVPISSSAWKLLLKEKSILIRSGLDSAEKKHAHWIKVNIT